MHQNLQKFENKPKEHAKRTCGKSHFTQTSFFKIFSILIFERLYEVKCLVKCLLYKSQQSIRISKCVNPLLLLIYFPYVVRNGINPSGPSQQNDSDGYSWPLGLNKSLQSWPVGDYIHAFLNKKIGRGSVFVKISWFEPS